MRERQMAGQMISELDMKQKFDQIQAQKDIEKVAQDQTVDFVTQAQNLKTQYAHLANQVTDLMKSWQDDSLKSYNDLINNLANGMAQLGVLAFVLHDLSVEEIRNAKLKNITVPKKTISVLFVHFDV